MIRDRLATHGQNDAYERGWREGWAACLARVERDGLDKVRQVERHLGPVPMTLAFGEGPTCECAELWRAHGRQATVRCPVHGEEARDR